MQATPVLDPVLFRSFRSIVVLADCSSGVPIFPAQALVEWLPRWDAWFKQASGIDDGERLSLLYGRSLQLLGRNFGRYPNDVVRVTRAATPLGFGCAVTLSVAECQQSWDAVTSLIAGAGVSSVYLDGRESVSAEHAALTIRDVVERLVAMVNLILIGPPSTWQQDGLLTSSAVNGTNWQMIPAGTSRLESDVANAFSPCRERFTLFITADGEIYPCQGLVGLAAFSLGNLAEPVSVRTLGAGRDVLHLADWAKRGPGLSGQAPALDAGDLAPVCRLHRATLMGASTEPEVSVGAGHALARSGGTASPVLIVSSPHIGGAPRP